MWTISRLALAAAATMLIAHALANGISGSTQNGMSFGANDGLSYKKVSAAPSSCNGVIDLSTGCTLGIVP